jgi:hypothetical protein
MTKKIITVAVGSTPKIGKNFYREKIIDYGYTKETVHIESDLNSLIEDLTRIRDQYAEYYTDLRIDSKRDCGCYGDCSCSSTYYVTGKRLENNIEYQYRLEVEARRAAQQDERDRKEYEALKAKFGKSLLQDLIEEE